MKEWVGGFKDNIPEAIGYLFTLWTLMNADHFLNISQTTKEEEKEDNKAKAYLFSPHPAQIISIFRILSLEKNSKKNEFVNNLVQIGTGEGKSITLAISAIVLALLGFEVNCACYSEYLSKRDRVAFDKLFTMLGVDKVITYGTFDKLSERLINKKIDIRATVHNYVKEDALPPQNSNNNEKL